MNKDFKQFKKRQVRQNCFFKKMLKDAKSRHDDLGILYLSRAIEFNKDLIKERSKMYNY